MLLLLVAQLLLPISNYTPGDVLNVTKEEICVKGYSSQVRNVPTSIKRFIFNEYGILNPKSGEYEIDHLISLELGGSNSLKNLWPQSYITQPWNAYIKDKLEDHLHSLVCNGKLELKEAQTEISTNWIEAYKKYLVK